VSDPQEWWLLAGYHKEYRTSPDNVNLKALKLNKIAILYSNSWGLAHLGFQMALI
jgi:hypothetical protein